MRKNTSRQRLLPCIVIVIVALAPAVPAMATNFCAPPTPPPRPQPDPPPDPRCEQPCRMRLTEPEDAEQRCQRSPCFIGTGVYTTSATDISIRTIGAPLEVSRAYRSSRLSDGPFGVGWTSSITPRLHLTRIRLSAETTAKEIQLNMPSGFGLRFTAGTGGQWIAPPGRREILEEGSGTWTLTIPPSGLVVSFSSAGLVTSISDEFGNGLAYAYDSNGRLTAISDLAPSGRSLNVVFGASGRIDAITDSTGRVVRYEYDAATGTLVKVYDASSSTQESTKYIYTTGRFGPVMSKIEDRWGREKTRLTWSSGGKLGSYTEGSFNESDPSSSAGEKHTYTYISATQTQSARAMKTSTTGSQTFPYDSNGLATDGAVYDSLGRTTRQFDGTSCRDFTYNARGNVETVTVRATCSDAPIGSWTFTYDSTYLDKPATISASFGWAGAQYTYVPAGTYGAGRVQQLRRVGRNGVVATVANYTYNTRGQITQMNLLDEGSVQYTYYPSGDLWNETRGGIQYTYETDALGRVTKVTGPGTRVTTYTYDVLDRITSATLPKPSVGFPYDFKTEYTYGYDSLLGLSYTEVKDPNSNVTRSSYDVLGHLVRHTDALNKTTQYTYRQNLLKSIEDANGNVTTYNYGPDRRLVSTTFPGGGTETYEYQGDRLSAVTDRRGNRRTYTYDAVGRLTALAFPALGQSINWNYSGEALMSLGGSMSSPPTSTTYTVDDWYRPITESLPNGRTISFMYTEPASMRLSSYTVALTSGGSAAEPSHTVSYYYDGSGRVNGITSNRINPSVGFSIVYTTDGAYDRITFPNGQQRKYTYDDQGRITRVENMNIATFDYAYDFNSATGVYTLGQRTAVFVSSPHSGLGSGARYRYDANYQLTRADDLTPGGSWMAWEYDGIGNRTSQSTPGGSTTYTYSSTNSQRLVQAGSTSFAYDANGNVTSYDFQNLVWDALNRLTQWANVQKTYDSEGRRTKQVFPGPATHTYVHRGNDTVRHVSTLPAQVIDYVFGPGIDEPLARITRTPPGSGGGPYTDQIEYLSADGLGSIVATNLPDMTVTGVSRYTEWGLAYASLGLFGYTGREAGSPAWFYRARYYEANFGRFLSEDPIGFAGSFTNFYRYADNDPINAVDPLGLAAELICKDVSTSGQRLGGILHCRIRATCENCPGTFDETFGMENVGQSGRPYAMTEWAFPHPTRYQDYYFRMTVDHPGKTECEFFRCLRAHNTVYGRGYTGRTSNGYVPAYNVRGPNSNTYARQLLDTCGGVTGTPPGAAGWDE